MSAQAEATAPPDDADDLRGLHFKLLLGKASTWILLGLAAVAAGVEGAVFLGPTLGGAAALGALLVGLLIVFAIADSRAEDSFFQAYALQRDLLLTGKSRLPAVTPLLKKGDDRRAGHRRPSLGRSSRSPASRSLGVVRESGAAGGAGEGV